jgi:hypothetical protein
LNPQALRINLRVRRTTSRGTSVRNMRAWAEF